MTRHLSLNQLTLLVVGFLLLAGLLILLLYAVHKMFQRHREQSGSKLSPARPADDTAFALATMQSLITGLKARERELQERFHGAEQRAEASARFLETVAHEIPVGLMIVDREGFLTLSNPAVRALLGIDTWSRRRYPEILGPESQLAGCIRACLQTGNRYEREAIECVTPHGETRALEMSLTPVCSQSGQVEGAVCLLADLEETNLS
jgi:PAS domain S-box-containing protein